MDRAVNYYLNRGYSEAWIEARLKGIITRNKLTAVWKSGGITEGYEYAQLTNEIYKSWSGMDAKEYKEFKGLRKESLRDNMSEIEIALADLGELATRNIARKEQPQGLKENLKVAHRGGNVAKGARDIYESEMQQSAITKDNNLNYQYIEEKAIDLKHENKKITN